MTTQDTTFNDIFMEVFLRNYLIKFLFMKSGWRVIYIEIIAR